jgi:putative ABC transport system substrate-binding protein
VTRRELIALLGSTAATAWPIQAHAQKTDRMRRIGVLTLASPKDEEHVIAAFVDGLRSHGYVEEKNLDIHYRYSDGDVGRLGLLAQELIALKPDVVLAAEPSPARTLKTIAPTLPIVCPLLTDAVLPELAASYARPGGSVTGIAQTVEGITGKLVELAQEFVPGLLRVGFLSNPTGASMEFFAQGVVDGARQRGVAVLTEQVMTRDALNPAFDHLVRQQAQAVIVPVNGLFRNEVARIVELAVAARLPTIFASRYGVEAGGLVSYGIDQRKNFQRAAAYVDKILKGANPGQMPIEFPTKIETVLNVKTAKALGIDVSPQLLARADEVIE